MSPEQWLPVLRECADRADAISTRYFRAGDLHVETKADRTLVTRADLEVETTIRELVTRRHPDVEIFGEEQGVSGGGGGTRLIVDPIDATANFARGIPVFATLLAIEDDGEVVTGLVSAPALHRRWHAHRGGGAWSGDRRLRVSGVRRLEDSQAFHGSIAGSEAVHREGVLAVLGRTSRQRGFGDFYQHMLVAEGCGEVALDPVLNPWDIAALQVIVEEAGGRATTVSGDRDIYGGSLISSNGIIHDDVLAAF